MKRILISGVAGLIGSHLADAMLKQGYLVTGLDNLSSGRIDNIAHARKNSRFVFRRADVANRDGLRRAVKGRRFDIVVHMAASKKIGQTGSSLKVLRNNLDSTVNMLDIAKRDNAKFIFASTSDVYGRSKDLPFNEEGDCVIGPSYIKRWAYAISKLYCESLVFAYRYEYGLKVVVLRYFGCFGSRANFGPSGGHVPLFIKKALNGRTIEIHGSGTQTRSMGHIDDIVRGTITAIENDRAAGEIINIGSDEEMSVKDSAMVIVETAKKMGKARSAKIRHIPMKTVFGAYKEISRRVPDLRKAGALLGYKPEIAFREAVRIVVREMAG